MKVFCIQKLNLFYWLTKFRLDNEDYSKLNKNSFILINFRIIFVMVYFAVNLINLISIDLL
jgi:hypothetical protein